ncbi:protein of unknown function DUF221 [Cynara cardunculus var. scolymus]|uniref:Uncharacterized protein n=1 Tax=Cynara cardunculus var. scolymus TaxID=59895 RepID=A0A103XTQ8_CYNCS|nr:protein of unknown function DUF221 [Cynara cardunculus var. scolymus]
MATLQDIGLAAAINVITALIFLIAFAFLRLQPFNDRVYFPKWYLKGLRTSPATSGAFVSKFINLDYRSYMKFLNWMPDALKMPEAELIDHAGLDSAVYLRIYLLGFYTHVIMAYAVTFWTCFSLKKEYETIANMRLHFLQSEKRRPDQFTVLVKNVPPDADESVSEAVEHFFLVVLNANKLADLVEEKKTKQNWLDYYQNKYSRNQSKRPMMKMGFLGLWGEKVDAIQHHISEIEKLSNETQQARNPTLWLTEWAPEPRDVFWQNLAIPYVSLTIRKLLMAVAFFFLTFFFIIPIAFVQSLANIEGIEKAAPFLKPIIEINTIKSFIQGFLPGIALKIFLILLPTILMTMSKFEGFLSISRLERRSASRYYLFNFVNVFLGSVIAGTVLEQLQTFLKQSVNKIPETIGVAIPMKATFFITYVMVDGWTGTAGEILRLKPLIIYHLKNFFLVKTEKDREEAMDPGSIGFNTGEPQIQLYFLIGLIYAVVTPLLTPFILIINVYNQEYESSAAFWPDVHGRIIAALMISQLLLMGLLSTKEAATSTPFLLALPILTIGFHMYCKGRYEPAFIRYPLQEAMMKDTLERAREPNLNLKGYLQNAYVHPIFKSANSDSDDDYDDDDDDEASDQKWRKDNVLVPTKRQSRKNTPVPSKMSAGSSPALIEIQEKDKP